MNLATNYFERVHNGLVVNRKSMVSMLFLPFVLLSAALGCWKTTQARNDWCYGDVFLSSVINSAIGYMLYIVLGVFTVVQLTT